MRTAIFIAFLCVATSLWRAADPPDCSTFTWDLSHELALFGGAAKPLAAAVNAAAAPELAVDTLYAIALRPLADVTFVHALGKDVPAEGGSGGVLKLHVANAGRYRITLDSPLWIDVVAANAVVDSAGFQGRKPCALIHKSVEWSLPANTDFIIQLGGSKHDQTKLAVTTVKGAP